MTDEQIAKFLEDYRDLVHRHGLGLVGKKVAVEPVRDPDQHTEGLRGRGETTA